MENVRETENAVRAEINGCHLLLIFEEQPVDGVFEKIRGILSSAYDDREETTTRTLTISYSASCNHRITGEKSQ